MRSWYWLKDLGHSQVSEGGCPEMEPDCLMRSSVTCYRNKCNMVDVRACSFLKLHFYKMVLKQQRKLMGG